MLRIAIVLAIALRLSLILVLGNFRVDDTATYLTGAQSIAARGAFLDARGNAEIFRTPGYPLVLAPFMALHASDAAIVTMNIVFAVLIVLVTWKIARQVFGDDRVAGICALIVAIEPTMLLWSLKVMPETLFTLCLVVFAYAAICEKPIAAAIALCAAIYVKPIAWPLALIVPFAAVWVRPKRALILLATCIVLLAPWHLRNYATADYAGFSSIMDRSIYISAGGSIAAREEGVPFAEMRRRLIARDDARAADPKRYAEMRYEGVSRLASDPFGWMKTQLFGTFRTLVEPGAAEWARTFGLYGGGGQSAMVDGGFRGFAHAHPILIAVRILMKHVDKRCDATSPAA